MTPRLVLVIAALTLREMVRRRVIWVLLVLVVASVAIVGWGVERLVSLARESARDEIQVRIGVSQILILIAFMFSFVLAMTAAFLAAPAIASDVETGTAHAMLARPLRRSDLLLGRWLGLSIIVGGYAVISGLFAIAVVAFVSGHVPPASLIAVGFLAFQAIAVLTLALALGTRLPAIAAGAVTVVLFGVGWFVGVLGGIAVVFEAAPVTEAAEFVRILVPTDGLWRADLRPRAADRRVDRGRRQPRRDGRQPVLRQRPTTAGVHRVESRLGRARALGRHRPVPLA